MCCSTKQGLGTSTADEAKQYFANIHSHRKEFVWEGELAAQADNVAATGAGILHAAQHMMPEAWPCCCHLLLAAAWSI